MTTWCGRNTGLSPNISGVRHLRLVLGTSAGGMQTWMWGEMYPGFMDALMPMAALPVEVAGRNWMMRRMLIDAIRSDPEWKDGNYEKQPRGFQRALVYFRAATNGGTQAIYNSWPTHEKADAELDRRLALPAAEDANNVLYEYEAARDYNPAPDLEKIQARLIAVNSADDERNPAELGIMEREIKRVTNGRYVLIPIGPETRGHGTTYNAKLWKPWLVDLLADRK
jgi:homoserine O-acetyltransferase